MRPDETRSIPANRRVLHTTTVVFFMFFFSFTLFFFSNHSQISAIIDDTSNPCVPRLAYCRGTRRPLDKLSEQISRPASRGVTENAFSILFIFSRDRFTY